MPVDSFANESASPPYTTDENRWSAVLSREKDADGKFYYSVATTGVYCRPSCASRRPRRENVRFHISCEEAEHAGFRPCKRCRPGERGPAEQWALVIGEACRAIEHAAEVPDLDEIARASRMSRFHFQRVFKSVTGVTPRAYFVACRTRRLQAELQSSKTVTEAIYGAGFNSSARFYANSGEMLGMQPKTFRKGGKDTSIRFAVGECSLGSILVAATGKGICSILLGDDPEVLVRDLHDRFPKAELVAGDDAFEAWVATTAGLVENPKQGFDLPLDVQGTAFQQRVWQALRDIPLGSTASYEEIATKLGTPKAVRAVAGACAANSIAVAIPCHRVVRKDGELSGYHWGVERKRALLEREANP
ncbi:MAG: bifunctional DNA-binding transcriptional regulator/O6-methylguanine-DNA methyltransferase Ada [Acidobacteriaceae bacterium]|nr:bifunctional DNA-binding transcriptional regulator/O6-methylguanine-DNA methyltransferase Ada [Acidobacteriaceae bacterium]